MEQYNPQKVAKQFNSATDTYDKAAIMQQTVGQRLVERLDFIQVDIKRILDLGAGTGFCTDLLRQKFPHAEIIALDLAELPLIKQQPDRLKICADAQCLPIASNSVDLAFSNMVVHWCDNMADTFVEMHRVLKPGGLLLFSTLGPDTLLELRQSWAEVDNLTHVHEFIDMHHIGDCLLQTGYADPVMDSEPLVIEYAQVSTLLKDLKASGASNLATNRNRALTSKSSLKQFYSAYEKFRHQECYPATYEVVYGHAWGKELPQPGEISISIDQIGRTISS